MGRTAEPANHQVHLHVLLAHLPLRRACCLMEGLRLVGQRGALVLEHLGFVNVGEHDLDILLPARMRGAGVAGGISCRKRAAQLQQ